MILLAPALLAILNKTPLATYLADMQRNEATLAAFGPPSMWKVYRYPFLFEGDSADRRSQTAAWLREHGYRKADVTSFVTPWGWTMLDRLAKSRGIKAANEWWPDEERLDQICRQ